MFVPRAVRLKGVHDRQQPKSQQSVSKKATVDMEQGDEDSLVRAMEMTSTSSPAPQQESVDHQAITRGPRFTARTATPEYISQLAAGIELIFTDYAHQDEKSSNWLQERYRRVDGEEKFIHLTAILEHTNISTLKPEATQLYLRQALQEYPSEMLELSKNGYYVRRRPSTYPFSFIPDSSFRIVDDEGLSFWDQRTIYVEPHLRNLCQTPAKVSHWLKAHGQMREKWLPIQAVHKLWNSCAFVVLSGSVMHEDIWNKWREAGKPENWKIMTKVEHAKRTAEYLELLKKENPKQKSKVSKPQPAKKTPASEPMEIEVDASTAPSPKQATSKRKRKRKKVAEKAAKDAQDHVTDVHSQDHGSEDVEGGQTKKRKR